jgi:hypothetical protein
VDLPAVVSLSSAIVIFMKVNIFKSFSKHVFYIYFILNMYVFVSGL